MSNLDTRCSGQRHVPWAVPEYLRGHIPCNNSSFTESDLSALNSGIVYARGVYHRCQEYTIFSLFTPVSYTCRLHPVPPLGNVMGL